MHYFPAIIKAVIPAMLAFYLVLAAVHLSIRAMGKSTGWLPVLPRFAMGKLTGAPQAEFEQFVTDRFDPGHFPLVHRRMKNESGSSAGHIQPVPGLLYQALVHEQAIPFVVECVWRLRFNGGILDLSDHPLSVYHNYQHEKGVPVFLIIGVGGTASEPQDCYTIPLTAVLPQVAYFPKTFLEQYRRTQADSVFFLDTDQMVLR